MRRRKIFELYDLDGNKLTEGNVNELADYVGCEYSTIRDCSTRPYVLFDKYRVVKTDRLEEIYEPKKAETEEPTYESNPYECLKMHLKAYGNAYCPIDPVPYFPWLLDEGLDCRCHEYQEFSTKKISKRGRPKKPKYYYIVEVVNADRGRKSI